MHDWKQKAIYETAQACGVEGDYLKDLRQTQASLKSKIMIDGLPYSTVNDLSRQLRKVNSQVKASENRIKSLEKKLVLLTPGIE